MYLHDSPKSKQVASDIGQQTGMLVDEAQVLVWHLPYWGIFTAEEGWITQVTLWNKI